MFFPGRNSEMIKSGGSNVAPLEVEAVLASFPEVRSAFVFGLPHPARGEEVTAVTLVVAGAGFDLDASAGAPTPSCRRTRCRRAS